MMPNSEAYQLAIKLLARREHSRLELFHKLKARGFESGDIENLLDELAAQNFQSDTRFAEAYVSMRKQKGYGPIRIQQELHEKGISDEITSQFLNTHDENWQMLAEQVRIKKFGQDPPETFEEKAKQMRFLQYRGFTHDQFK